MPGAAPFLRCKCAVDFSAESLSHADDHYVLSREDFSEFLFVAFAPPRRQEPVPFFWLPPALL